MEILNTLFGSGDKYIEAALVIGLFWAAIIHPERIRSLVAFRFSTIFLGLSIIAPIFLRPS